MSEASDILGDREYIVTEVVAIDPPDGESGKWFRYTISNASAPISGQRAGSQKSVTKYAEEFAANLNERAMLGYSTYGARRVQKKQTPTDESS